MVLWTPSPKPADVEGAEPSSSSAEKAMNKSLLAKDINEKEFPILAMLAKALGNTFNEGTEDLLFGEIVHRKSICCGMAPLQRLEPSIQQKMTMHCTVGL